MDLQPLALPLEETRSLTLIAGPCSAESEEQVLETARRLACRGVKVFRAGIWKPRTKPGGFEGIGIEGLSWLQRVKRETGMMIATEVATEEHVRQAIRAGIDLLWIGARTTVNPFAVQEIADALRGHDLPVLVKNPVNPDLELWIGAIERLHRVGIRRIGAIHRGFSSADKTVYRNAPLWEIPRELRRRIPNLPILCDPSHIGGKRELIEPLSQKAVSRGYDGLLIETHSSPEQAWSDAAQQITPEEMQTIVERLSTDRTENESENLEELRQRIDLIDEQLLELLSRRMRISGEIGAYKRENGLSVVQPTRYGEILEKRISLGVSLDLSPRFVKEILSEIHDESVRRQTVSTVGCG